MREQLKHEDVLTERDVSRVKRHAEFDELVLQLTHTHVDFHNAYEVLEAVKNGDVYEGSNGEIRVRNSGTVVTGYITRGLIDYLQVNYSGTPTNNPPVEVTHDNFLDRLAEHHKFIEQDNPPGNVKTRRQARFQDVVEGRKK